MVYTLLAGRYPGNTERQVLRIEDAMSGTTMETRMYNAIKAEACKRCSVQGECDRCARLFEGQAKAAASIHYQYR